MVQGELCMNEAESSQGVNHYPPERLVGGLRKLLRTERLDTDLYRGLNREDDRGRVFGGQVIAQALDAASQSVEEDRIVHSLHAYFLRAGEEGVPIIYRVERDFDGRSISNRRVIAIQHGRPIFNFSASFQRPAEGLTHQLPMPDVPGPEDLPGEIERLENQQGVPADYLERMRARPRPIEFRTVETRFVGGGNKQPPFQHAWMRAVAPVDGPAAEHRTLFAFASDMLLLGTCTLPHGVHWATEKLMMTSIDHALWYHEDFRMDEWLLFALDSPWSGHARGFNRGSLYTRDGRLVASATQEGMMRLRK